MAAFVPDPLAASIGAGVDMTSPYGHMVVDIGEGITDMAVIHAGCLVATAAVRTACGSFYGQVTRLLDEQYGVVLPRSEIERLTRKFGGLPGITIELPAMSKGCECRTRTAATVHFDSREISEAIRPAVCVIADQVSRLLRGLSAQTACEVIESGVCLTGGGSCIPGVAEVLAAQTGLEVRVAVDPIHAVINGAAQMLEHGFQRVKIRQRNTRWRQV